MHSKKTFLFFKRLIDILLSIIFILLNTLLLWPLIIIINTIITNGHPFYISRRLGKKKEIFKIIKFRTMKYGAPIIPPYKVNRNEIAKYETKFGAFLRKTSIDETPQFINIFIGQMSIVGPRPCAEENEDELVNARDSTIPSAFDVKPGLTGYAQIQMKRKHDVLEKAKYDSAYVKQMSLWLDLKIMFKTLLVVFFGE